MPPFSLYWLIAEFTRAFLRSFWLKFIFVDSQQIPLFIFAQYHIWKNLDFPCSIIHNISMEMLYMGIFAPHFSS